MAQNMSLEWTAESGQMRAQDPTPIDPTPIRTTARLEKLLSLKQDAAGPCLKRALTTPQQVEREAVHHLRRLQSEW